MGCQEVVFSFLGWGGFRVKGSESWAYSKFFLGLPKGSIVVPFWGSYTESYKVIPKRNYYGAFG